MLSPDNILLLSIKPKYAEQIFTGIKTVELRRVKTRLKTGDLVFVYVTSPDKQLLGWFEVESITEFENKPKEINKIWEQIGQKTGITRPEFNNYYQGASLGVIISIKNPKKFNNPVKLHTLRQKFSNFTPPQSYRYLSTQEVNKLEKIAKQPIIK